MKIPFVFHLLFAVLLISGCTTALQEQEIEVAPELALNKKVVITARIGGPETKVSYFEDRVSDPEGRPFLHQQWNIGDWVYGFYDKSGHRSWMYLQVTGILEENGERIAILSPSDGDSFPETGYIHLFYCGRGGEGGPEAVDLSDIQSHNKLAFNDFSDWYSPFTYMENPDYPEDNNVAGIMTADAEVRSSVSGDVLTVSADLTFENQMAIIGIEGIQVDPGAVIDRIELSGVRTGAVYSLETVDGKPHLVLDAGGFDDDQTVAVNLDYYPQADEEGKIMFSGPLFIAVYPSEGEEGTEGLVLRARMSGEDETEFYYYTYILGPKTIEKGKYYYIPTKTFSGPPAVRVVFDEGEESTFSSLEEACVFIATLDDRADPRLQLLQDCTVNNPVVFTTTSSEQIIYLELEGKTLTLEDGAYLEASGPILLSISSGTIIQTSDAPVLLSSADVCFESASLGEVTMFSSASSVSPIQVTDGAVTISGGYFGWTDGPLISSSSTYPSIIEWGRFSIHPTLTDNVVLQDGMVIAQDDYIDFPFMCLPESVYDNLAHTSGGVIKTFSINRYGYQKVYLTKNNLYRDQNDNWLFEEGPNWEGQNQNSDTHRNLFTFSELTNGTMSVSEDVSVGGDLYSWLNSSQWDDLLNRVTERYEGNNLIYEPKASFMKCNVEDSENALWRNLLVFPDTYDWPSGAGEIPDAINNGDMPWSDTPVFTADQANALIDAGFVFLPAAVPAESEGFYGGYLSSSSEIHYIFNNDYVGSNRDPRGSNYNQYSLHVYYPCE